MNSLIENAEASAASTAATASVRLAIALLCLVGRNAKGVAERTVLEKCFLSLQRPEFLRLDEGRNTSDLRIGDLAGLSSQEKLNFIRGAMALLREMSIREGICICNMPALVMLPVSALADLMEANSRQARLAFRAMRKVTLFCADRADLNRASSYEDFVMRLTARRERLDLEVVTEFAESERLAGRRLREAYARWAD